MNIEILSDLLEYDPASSTCLRWSLAANHYGRGGREAGSIKNSTRYVVVGIQGVQIPGHRAVWMMFHGEIPQGMDIDHIDGNRSNNRIENLRLATRSQNTHNQGPRKNSVTGIKGLSWDKSNNRWCGQIWFKGKVFAKRSPSRQFVENWLIETRGRLHGEFARHN